MKVFYPHWKKIDGNEEKRTSQQLDLQEIVKNILPIELQQVGVVQDAALWWNLLASGRRGFSTEHGVNAETDGSNQNTSTIQSLPQQPATEIQ